VKLIRLLAPLAMLIAGLAAPAPAAAGDPVPVRPLSPGALRDVCAVFQGAYSEDGRLASACELSDGAILCEVTDESVQLCQYHPRLERRDLPPLNEPCELVRGTIRDGVVGQISCELKDGVITVVCPVYAELSPWWAWPERVIIVCEVGWIPSEQPMT